MNKILLSMIFCVHFFLCHANNFTDRIQFTAQLDGAQVNPFVTTGAKGLFSLIYNITNDSMFLNLSCIALNSKISGVKIYSGAEGINGFSIKDLSNAIRGNSLSIGIKGADIKTNLKDLFNNNLYIVVETASHLSGELRGQIKLETDYNFTADLKGSNTIPASTSNAFGLGSFTLSHDEHSLDFKIICSKLSGPIKSAQLWIGNAGEIGKMDIDITSSVKGNILIGSINPTHSMTHDLFDHKIYLTINTAANPNGEIRAQLIHHKGLIFESWASGDQVYIPVNTSGKAISVIRISPGLDSLYYDSVSDGLTPVEYAHLHVGDFGQPYGNLQVDFTSSISGARIKGFKRNPSKETIRRMLISNLAFVYHTAANENGEVRGQAVRMARNGFAVNMDGKQVVPPTTTEGYGLGIVSTSRNDDNVHYMWLAGNLSGLATSSQFGNGLQGIGGSMIYDMSSEMNANLNTAEGSGYWTKSDNPSFTSDYSNLFASENVYLEVSTKANPKGEIRGQTSIGRVVLLPTSINDFHLHPSISISPNPVNDDLLIKIEENSEVKNISIFNEMGVLVKNIPVDRSSKVDVSSLPKGLYFIRANQDQRFGIKMLKL
jgi:hypothetical protein